jgi:hypothetical protein
MKIIKCSPAFLFFLSYALLVLPSCTKSLTLADQGRSEYIIVLPLHASNADLKAGTELQKYLHEISGCEIPIGNDSKPMQKKEIILGKNFHLKELRCRIDFDSLKEDGFTICTKGNHLIIAGGGDKGTLYGVYTFLEEYLGCRYYSPEAKIIQQRKKIIINKTEMTQVPDFNYRELYFPAAQDSSFRDWHKLDRHENGHGDWGLWVHTYNTLLPPDIYFKDHPEYYSEIGGKRIPDGQLCLTNRDVMNLVAIELHKRVDEQPEARYWSVSQNDNYLACQCENCKYVYDKFGGPSATVTEFANRMAREFPDKVISTLAYQFSRPAPKEIKIADNLNIMLCTIECNRSHPIETDPESESFRMDISDWTKLTHNILLWDYVVQFRNYMDPFPNLRVLQPNLKFFRDMGCTMMFQQGSGNLKSEFVDLRSYLVAKLMWDPDADFNAIMDDFLTGYYGAAGTYIHQYIDKMHDALDASGADLTIYGYPFDGIRSYLRPELIPGYESLFDQAEQAVRTDPVLLDRVITARLPLEFAILDLSLRNRTERLSFLIQEDGNWQINDEMLNRLDRFTGLCKNAGINALNEDGTTPEEYRAMIGTWLEESLIKSISLNKPVELFTAYSPKYDAGGEKALTDGLRGLMDYHYNWLGFEGEDMSAVIDLGKEMPVHEISMDFLQQTGAWIFLPKRVDFYVSLDGNNFTRIRSVTNQAPETQEDIFKENFSSGLTETNARYVKVFAINMKTCPSWHIGAGSKAWLFTDEIVVK